MCVYICIDVYIYIYRHIYRFLTPVDRQVEKIMGATMGF